MFSTRDCAALYRSEVGAHAHDGERIIMPTLDQLEKWSDYVVEKARNRGRRPWLGREISYGASRPQWPASTTR